MQYLTNLQNKYLTKSNTLITIPTRIFLDDLIGDKANLSIKYTQANRLIAQADEVEQEMKYMLYYHPSF